MFVIFFGLPKAGNQCQPEAGDQLSLIKQSCWDLFWLKHRGKPFKCCGMFQV